MHAGRRARRDRSCHPAPGGVGRSVVSARFGLPQADPLPVGGRVSRSSAYEVKGNHRQFDSALADGCTQSLFEDRAWFGPGTRVRGRIAA
jgi:hypothetical protein